jgi:hypothetical protein
MNYSDITTRLANINISILGDHFEKENADFIRDHIPNYERFWKYLVFPYRTEDDSRLIHLAPALPVDHETVCIYNYSLFRSCLKINNYLQQLKKNGKNKTEHSEYFDNCFLWLTIAYNQLNMFAVSFLKTFISQAPAGEINVANLSILETKDLLNQYLTECIKRYDKPLVNSIKTARDTVAKIRNYIAHGPKFPGYEDLIPKPDNIKDLIQWSKFNEHIKSDPSNSQNKLIDRTLFADQSVNELFSTLNTFWNNVLTMFEAEYSSKEYPNSQFIHSTIKSTNDAGTLSSFLTKKYEGCYSSNPTVSGIQYTPVSGSTSS